MDGFLAQLDQTPAEQQWAFVRRVMEEAPLELYSELREYRPILVLPELTLVTRYSDCATVLRQHDCFSVALYRPKQGDYWMPEDDTARHWREKSVMRAILDLENLPDIRTFVAQKAKQILAEAGGSIDVARDLSRAVPIAMVQELFGFDESDPQQLFEWSYWSQQDTFHNQPFDSVLVEDQAVISATREAKKVEMGKYLGGLLQRRAADLKSGIKRNDPTTRLLKLLQCGALKLSPELVALNVGGLLIGAVETTSHASVNAIEGLLDRPEVAAQARLVIDDTNSFDGYVFESLRFKPAFPYFFRTCERAVVLAGDTDYEQEIRPGTTVLAVTHSAMFDQRVFPNPGDFDHRRPMTANFHFGQGIHECLGRHIGAVMIPEIVRQVMKMGDATPIHGVEYRGGVPEHYPLRW